MPEAAEQRKPSDQSDKSDRSDSSDSGRKTGRSLTGFYVAICAIIVLGLFGFWFWRAYTVWWFDADEARRRQAEAAAKLGVPVEIAVDLPPSPSGSGAARGDGVKLDLILVPAGRFRMGSPKDEQDRREDEMQHWVVITRPFYIGKYEVTQEQWEKVTGTSPSAFKGAKNPVECVSWDDSQKFLKKLTTLCPQPFPPVTAVGAGLKPAPTNGVPRAQALFRLPTEAEWEWACRAGTRTRFCSGGADETLADYGWFSANPGNSTRPVGTKKPNAWGLHDLHGNIWEWCGDWYDEHYYAKCPRHDPTGPATGSFRVFRGGSWPGNPGRCRSSVREGRSPGDDAGGVGFRVLMAPVAP